MDRENRENRVYKEDGVKEENEEYKDRVEEESSVKESNTV